jgi:putative ABC transport system permease protein
VTFGVALLTGLLFGLAPATSLSRHDLVEAFKEDGTRTTSSRRSAWMRRALVVAEVALCMLLLVGAALLVQTFVKMRSIDPGFDPDGIVTGRMSLGGERYASPAAVNGFFEQGLERIRRIPGVESAAVVSGVPIERGLNLNVTVLDGPEGGGERGDRLALRHGRLLRDDGDPRRHGPDLRRPRRARRAAGGRREPGVRPAVLRRREPARSSHPPLRTGRPDADRRRGARRPRAGLVGPLPPLIYVPAAQATETTLAITHGYFPTAWVVRTTRPGAPLIESMREEIRRIDPQQPFTTFRTMNEVKAMQFQREQFQMTLFAILGGIGLLLAAAGIYGLVSYSVVQRTREYGIRLALGASAGHILRSVIRQGAVLALAGVVIGVLIASFATRRSRASSTASARSIRAPSSSSAWLLIAVAVVASLVPGVSRRAAEPGQRAARIGAAQAFRPALENRRADSPEGLRYMSTQACSRR